MYYSDITNEELQYFHHLQVPNFSIKLSDVLHKTNNTFDNKLFRIEEIIADNLYRIYPMFYTTTVASSNSNDTILENKCIICHKQDKETFLTFISNENEEIQDYNNTVTYYEIEDTLTTSEYNSIISLLRANTVHQGDISLKQKQTNGEYGKYTFNLNSTTLLDDGILITDETLTNIGTAKLEDAVFPNSTYTLKLTVYHITDVNVCDISDDNIVKDTLLVELHNNEKVNIPFNTLDYNYIVSYDAEIIINHNKPVIHYYKGNMKLTASKNEITAGEVIDLTSQLQYMDSTPYEQSNITVYFFKEE